MSAKAKYEIICVRSKHVYSPSFRIGVPESRELVSVFKDSDMRTMTWESSRIQWSTVSPVSQEDAARFIECMKRALREAKRLDREYPPGSDYRPYLNKHK